MIQRYTLDQYEKNPYLVFYEITRACDLKCAHCRACAQPDAHKNELSIEQSKQLADQLASFDEKPMLVITGGDPMKREDIYDYVNYASGKGLKVAITPSVTPLLTKESLDRLKANGLSSIAFSLDSPVYAKHDRIRGIEGIYRQTLYLLRYAKSIGLRTQVNTTLTSESVNEVDEMAHLLAEYKIDMWSVFFLVPVGRGLHEERITAREYEHVFEKLWHHQRHRPFTIKTTEAHHYRRYVMQRQTEAINNGQPVMTDYVPKGIHDGCGVMFISHTGQIFPSGFLPYDCGRFPEVSVVDTYRDHPAFVQLRDADQLKGKCGECEYRQLCGGSRARAYALSRDLMAPEPDCVYQPSSWVGDIEYVECE